MSKASARGTLKTDMIGIWQLQSRVEVDPSGREHIDPALGPEPLGILCFSESYFAAQYMKRDRSGTNDNAQLTRGSNFSSVLNGYDGHFGTYRVDAEAGILRVKLEGAVSPGDIGREFERHIEVRGDKLTIWFAASSPDGTPVTRTLTFIRLA